MSDRELIVGFTRRMAITGVVVGLIWALIVALVGTDFTTFTLCDLAFGAGLGLLTGILCGYLCARLTLIWFRRSGSWHFYRVLMMYSAMFAAFWFVFVTARAFFPCGTLSISASLLHAAFAAYTAGRAGDYFGRWWYLHTLDTAPVDTP